VSHGTDVGLAELIDEAKDSGGESVFMQCSRGKVLAARYTLLEAYEGGLPETREAATPLSELTTGDILERCDGESERVTRPPPAIERSSYKAMRLTRRGEVKYKVSYPSYDNRGFRIRP